MVKVATRVDVASVARRIYVGRAGVDGRVIKDDNLIYAEDGQGTGNVRDNVRALVIATAAVSWLLLGNWETGS